MADERSSSSALPSPSLSSAVADGRETLAPGSSSTSSRGKAKSCRECIRLKHKCSREPWPCRQCAERGLDAMCPDGQLSTRPYKRGREPAKGRPSSSVTTLTSATASANTANEDSVSRLSPPATAGLERPGTHSKSDSASGIKKARVIMPALPKSQEYNRKATTGLQSGDPASTSRGTTQQATPADEHIDSGSATRGTLMFERSGQSRYYGPGSHSFLLAQSDEHHDTFMYSRAASPHSESSEEALAVSLTELHGRAINGPSPGSAPLSIAESGLVRQKILDFPSSFIAIPGVLSPFEVRRLVEQLCSHLPSKEESRRAFRVYKQNVTWMYDPISSIDKLWDTFYLAAPRTAHLHPHRVSLMFIVLALGVLFDVSNQRPLSTRRAERYYHWSWAAIQLSNPSDTNTLEHAQAIHLIGQYLCNRKNGRNADSAFTLLGTAMRSSIAMGLHREGRAWGLPVEELEERKRLFWELYASDCFRSLAYGRPCSIQDAHIDASFPSKRSGRELSDSFHNYKYQIIRILNRILDVCQRPNVPYTSVLDLDHDLRELWALLPPELNPLPSGHPAQNAHADFDRVAVMDESADSEEACWQLRNFLQGHTLVANINQSLLHLHRPWFLKALQDEQHHRRRSTVDKRAETRDAGARTRNDRRDAFDSQYARSLLAVSESSRALIHTAQAVLDLASRVGLAWNFFWQHCFNAGVCQCLQILHNPSSIMTFGAWDDVRRALSVLRSARPDPDDVIWAGKIDLLERMKQKAESQLKANHEGRDSGHAQASSREQLRLVGATSSIDRRGANGETEEGRQGASPDSSKRAGIEGAAFDPKQGQLMFSPASFDSSMANFSDGMLSGEAWIPSLSHSIIDSLLEGGDSYTLPANQPFDQAMLPQQQQQNPHSSQTPGIASVSRYSTQSATPGIDSFAAAVPNTNLPDSAQFDWLLTELLQGGNEPEASFWEGIFRGQTS